MIRPLYQLTHTILLACAPDHNGNAGLDAERARQFLNDLPRAVPTDLRLGLYAAVLWVWIAPVIWHPRHRLFTSLSADEQDEMLQQFNASSRYLPAQLATILRMFTGFAFYYRRQA